METNDDAYLAHYGTPRHSGRYPWGSGENPYQRNASFIGYVRALKKEGVSEVQIAKGMGMTTKQLRARLSIAKDEKRMADAAEALRLKNKGYSNVAIGKRMGINESSVRSLLDPALQKRSEMTMATANALKDQVDNRGWIDVGAGVENYMGVSSTKLDTAIEVLRAKGYELHNIKVEQLGTGNFTTVKVLCPPGTTWAEVVNNKDKIKSIATWSEDGGREWKAPKPPKSVDSNRVQVRYAEDGGIEKDGVIELRRGVADISLGNSTYAQVRIAVDKDRYLKGMAVYSDDMPDGVDIIFNTNKHKGTPKLDVMKKMNLLKDGTVDPENPFGASVKQHTYIDKDGKKQQSCINIVNAEGTWEEWKKSLPSQFLSKQSEVLAKKQLALRYDSKKDQFDEIMSLTQPTIRKKLLESFAEDCDSSASHLEAAAMPRQATQVLLPLPSLKENEIYAPRFQDGEKVVLIRFPHGGKFEIPELTVNNKNPEGKKVITPKSRDAVGINAKVAEQLSGADFDGDTALVIPNKKGPLAIRTQAPLNGLKNFDPKEAYPKYEGMKVMDSRTKGIEMGKVSNLITDMTILGADDDEICRAVRHSMVVIDAEKHELNWKQSEIDNGIAELNKKYRGKANAGASTIISRAGSEVKVDTRRVRVDPKTGEKVYFEKKGDTYVDKSGKTVHRTETSTRMAEVKDAFELVSGGSRAKTTAMEVIYAEHANSLKKLANQARKEAAATKPLKQSSTAKETYAEEVASLKRKLSNAERNAPLERQAQLIANVEIKAKKEANPDMDRDTLKKEKGRALERARYKVGANKKEVMVEITDREWDAIQAGAISNAMLTKILNNTDEEKVKKMATPKQKVSMTDSRVARAKAMLNANCTMAEVAKALGVSVSTLSRALKEE